MQNQKVYKYKILFGLNSNRILYTFNTYFIVLKF